MDVFELRAYATLARRLHYGRAALELNMSVSTLSRLISRIEQELGARLIIRNASGHELSQAGRTFLDFAESVLHDYEDLRSNLAAQREHPSGRLELYASVTACYSIVPNVIQSCSRAFPDISWNIVTGDSALALEKVKNGESEFAIAAKPSELEGGLLFYTLQRSTLVFVGNQPPRPGHENLDIQTLVTKYPVILPERGVARERFDALCVRSGEKIRPISETSGSEAILALVQLGIGLGLVPLNVYENSPLASKLFVYRLIGLDQPFEIGITCAKKRLQNPVTRAVWDHICGASAYSGSTS